jgi:hypothetical protein
MAFRSIGFGEPWTRPASCSTSWSNADATIFSRADASKLPLALVVG